MDAAARDAADFKAWRERCRWTQVEAAQQLGISPRSVQLYESGTVRVPRPVRLACSALLHRVHLHPLG